MCQLFHDVVLVLSLSSTTSVGLDFGVESVAHYQDAKEGRQEESDGHALFIAAGVVVVAVMMVIIPTAYSVVVASSCQQLGRLLSVIEYLLFKRVVQSVRSVVVVVVVGVIRLLLLL